ncbi:AMP-binding protein [Microbacterium sp. Marseille-Q6965]|uniref:AMP-binding protein n=1 Tax=Microbacterium sp. Marseille-Q6965 TaxID=2965072 RepID=UPI0021B8050E|nr:AMP-binding protein [Microbacterium sp. Marseille-Q6965]
MRLEPIRSDDPRDVLRALRGAVLGAGPAVALGGGRELPAEVPGGTAVVLTTSGSTGVPKSVALSRSALTSSALATAARIGEGHWLLPLSGGYIAGVQVMVRALVAGREPAILAGRFSARAFAHAASGMRSTERGEAVPTYTSLVPAQLQTLVDAAAEDADVRRALASFHTILVGGQALPPALRERAAEWGARIVRTYGSTETSGGCVYDGVPLDGVRVATVDGELRIAGPTLAEGYVGEPRRTAETFVADPAGTRWYRTGDAGTVAGGIVSVAGRIDNVIVSGGVNVSLDRVERVVQGVPGLEGAVVVGGAHERWGETPVVVVAGEHAPELLDRARAVVEGELGKPARPDRLVTLPELPRLPSGKPDRRAIARAVGLPARD